MAKVFRIHEGQQQTGWFSSNPVKDSDLDSIITEGKKVSNSVPSPYARIDLVTSAFEWASRNSIEGDTAQHQLVSDALDVGQLMFFSNRYSLKLDIIGYNPEINFENHFNSSIKKHQDLADALKMYWSQDEKVYNFQDTNQIYFLLYNHELIGATSPASLFVPAPVSQSLRGTVDLWRGGNKYFGKEATSIINREWDFVKYLYLFSKQSNFADVFPEVYNYLDKAKNRLTNKQQREINGLNATSISEYTRSHASGQPGDYCSVVGFDLHIAKAKAENIEKDSSFVIESDYSIESPKPLVLPNKSFSEEWAYTSSDVKWEPQKFKERIPDRNQAPLDNSKLPIHNNEYPWLSADNFLADSIIELPYDIDAESFTVSNNKDAPKNYLLPLTETFFQYFSPDKVSDMLSIREFGQGSVEVELHVPVRGGKIKFTKDYKLADKITAELHLAIMPFVKIEHEDIPVKYNVGIIDGDAAQNKVNDISVNFYSEGKSIKQSSQVIRGPGKGKLKTLYLSTSRYFDVIKISCNGISGFIHPKMPKYEPSTDDSHFAIDLGTTNTHISYKINNNVEKSLDNNLSTSFWKSLLDRKSEVNPLYLDNEQAYEREFIPYRFGGENSEIGFPLRTAMVENKSNINFQQPLEIFKHLNNYLLYEKIHHGDYLRLNPNLKWDNLSDVKNEKRLKLYISNLIQLIFYKLLTSNLSISNTSITWFYPVSMSVYRRNLLKGAWKSFTKEILGKRFDEGRLFSIPESIGPYYHYHKKHALQDLTVSIDVGGGSSDISIYKDGKPKTISSFRFAGDTIFGDGYGKAPERNGFVQAFKKEAYSYLQNNENEDVEILDSILTQREASNDFSSYLFSLSADSNGAFNYASLIKKDADIKVVILVFHAAIAYYIGKLMKGEGFNIPKYILFSGTAAKTLNIIDTSDSLENISGLFKFILEKTIGQSSQEELRCELSDDPKEITAKGGLQVGSISTDGYQMTDWFGGEGEFDKNFSDQNSNNGITYEELNPSHYSSVIASVEEFFKVLDDYFDSVNSENLFGINRSAYKLFKEIRHKDLEEDLKNGLKKNIGEYENKTDDPIDESLFFYPLVGLISKLAYQLTESR
jgi:hypothetical protein